MSTLGFSSSTGTYFYSLYYSSLITIFDFVGGLLSKNVLQFFTNLANLSSFYGSSGFESSSTGVSTYSNFLISSVIESLFGGGLLSK